MPKGKLKTLGNIASRLVPALAPAAGALAAPANPRLGAAVAGGIANAIFPSAREKQQADFAENRNTLANAAGKRAQERHALGVTSDTNVIDAQDRALGVQEFGVLQQQSIAMTKGLVQQQLFDALGGQAATEAQMATMMASPAIKDHTRAMMAVSSLSALRNNPDLIKNDAAFHGMQMAMTGAGLNLSRDEKGAFAVTDIFKRGSGPDGTWTDDEIAGVAHELRNHAMREIKFRAVIDGLDKNPPQQYMQDFIKQSLANDAEPEMALLAIQQAKAKYGEKHVVMGGILRLTNQLLKDGHFEDAGLMAAEGEEYLQSQGLDVDITLPADGMPPRSNADITINFSKHDPWLQSHLKEILDTPTADGTEGIAPTAKVPSDVYYDLVNRDLEEMAVIKADPIKRTIKELEARNQAFAYEQPLVHQERQKEILANIFGLEDSKELKKDHFEVFSRNPTMQISFYRAMLGDTPTGSLAGVDTAAGAAESKPAPNHKKDAGGLINASSNTVGGVTAKTVTGFNKGVDLLQRREASSKAKSLADAKRKAEIARTSRRDFR